MVSSWFTRAASAPVSEQSPIDSLASTSFKKKQLRMISRSFLSNVDAKLGEFALLSLDRSFDTYRKMNSHDTHSVPRDKNCVKHQTCVKHVMRARDT